MKCCRRCGVEKPHDAFQKDRRASDGLFSSCRMCQSEAKKQKYHADREKAREKNRLYYERNKETILASNAKSRVKHAESVAERKRKAYERDREKPEFIAKQKEYIGSNKAQKKEYDREYRRRNEERLKIIKAKYVAENQELIKEIKTAYKVRRRATERSGDSTRTILEWRQAQVKKCKWCEVDCEIGYHVDHIVPLSKGGTHTVGNLCIACPTCNLRKNAMMPDEFIEYRKRMI